MKVSGALITGLLVCFLFMFLGCSETPTSLEDQKANLNELNKYGEPGGGGGGNGGIPDPDPDSDRPPWAGGAVDSNSHRNPNQDAGDKRGEDYGDLYVVLRFENGEPDTIQIPDPKVEDPGPEDVIWVVQPIAFQVDYWDAEGNPVLMTDDDGIPLEAYNSDGSLMVMEYDELGEIVPPEGQDVAVCECDFGRLNLIRAPKSRLDQALGEAIKSLTTDILTIRVDFCGRLTAVYNATDPETGEHLTKTIDSPRENMAVYRELMASGFGGELAFLATYFNEENAVLHLAASAFAAGGDKTGYVIVDEVCYCNTFLNLNDYSWDHYNNYSYSREIYKSRYIRMKLLDGVYDENRAPISIFDAFASNVGQLANVRFTLRWGQMDDQWSGKEAFSIASDDAVQVLEFIHGDSNIDFLPDYVPPEELP